MNKKPKLTTQIKISEIVEYYPELIELLIIDYGFHCIGCVASAFESLEEGALVHGIVGEDLEELMERLEAEVDKQEEKENDEKREEKDKKKAVSN